ncbi:MAG: DUF411 domain-containing protein [Gemmatimonadales bacterium]
MTVSRREFLTRGAAVGLGLTILPRLARAAVLPSIAVYKSPTCGCCGSWVDHMKANGFEVAVHDLDDLTPIKARYGVGSRLQSCHTALVGGYVIEGHVPASDVKQLLEDRPKIVGLTIPGMPMSAPGMDGKPFQPYDVLTFDAAGKTTLYKRHTS